MFGSAAHDLAWVTEGRIDAAIILSNKNLDVAAGVLIAREAVVLVVDSSGNEHTSDYIDTLTITPDIAKNAGQFQFQLTSLTSIKSFANSNSSIDHCAIGGDK